MVKLLSGINVSINKEQQFIYECQSIYVEIKNPIEFATALGDASHPKPGSLRASDPPCMAPSLS
jgi:hypothetical protein